MEMKFTHKGLGIFNEASKPILRGGNRRLFLGVLDDLLSQLLGSFSRKPLVGGGLLLELRLELGVLFLGELIQGFGVEVFTGAVQKIEQDAALARKPHSTFSERVLNSSRGRHYLEGSKSRVTANCKVLCSERHGSYQMQRRGFGAGGDYNRAV